MIFRELLGSVEVLATGGDQNVAVTGIAYDSRQVQPGFLFVAVKGFVSDGHEYIQDSLARGAAAVVVERGEGLLSGVSWAMVPDSRLALALLSARFFGYPSTKLKMIGVTGTNGKTTTTNLIASILKGAGWKVGLIGTIQNKIGDRVLPVRNTTPESTDLQALLYEMAAEGIDACIMEVSSHALALRRVDGCEFDVVVFTNLTQDHLDFHRDMEEYLAAKKRLFGGLSCSRVKTPEYSVLNADDPSAPGLAGSFRGKVITYGIKGPADVGAHDIQVTAGGSAFTASGEWGCHRLSLKMTGFFNVYNALAAYTTASVLGVPAAAIKSALEAAPGVPGRFELVERGQDFAVIVDYAHTPDGLENILKTARKIARGRLITVFGCGGDRDRGKRPQMGAIASGYSDITVITSDNPRTEDPLAIIREIEQGLKSGPDAKKYHREPDRRKAIHLAVGMAGTGDVIVIAGKGHETYQIVGKESLPFDDRLEVVAALGKRGFENPKD
ncbi:MAG: UDP-N-acetylmuramoyl-L-alanyl-D-glutamate--2,6-diaminopimelate ligase [Firmicutes bacterium ADurb.Bin456]|nr:MAG: UDP-N-acetylmuramoyl-L-alanyl-D-glutamate--2,6-diaminopimelate ligase [Firmicutes bacterium ADurb.Bin456]